MNIVKVKTSELLKAILRGRDKHAELFDRAMAGYRRTVEAELERYLTTLRDPKGLLDHEGVVKAISCLKAPVSHVADYDRVLDMLGMSVDTEITLTAQEFDQYVRDNWGWKQDFMRTSEAYSR